MNVTRSQQGRVAILAVHGPLVGEELDGLDSQVDECVNAGLFKVVLDLGQTPFIDSAGLERLQSIVSDLGKRGGDLRVAALNDVCQDIFWATRMESFVQVFADRESAIRSLL